MSVAVQGQRTGRGPRLPRFTLAVPSWAWYLLFFLLPLAIIVVYSFGYKPGTTASSSIGLDRLSLDNYRTALGDEIFASTFAATLRVATVGTLLCLAIGFPVAYLLATRVSARWRPLMLALLIVPFWTSYLLRTFGWRLVLAGRGFPSQILQDLGILQSPIAILDTRVAVQIGVVYNYLPLMIFPLFVALDRLDPALREASKDLGAGRVRTFFQVTLPLIRPALMVAIVFRSLDALRVFDVIYVLTGDNPSTASMSVYARQQLIDFQQGGMGSAAATFLFVIVAVFATIVVTAGRLKIGGAAR